MNAYELMAKIINEQIHRKYIIDGIKIKYKYQRLLDLLFV